MTSAAVGDLGEDLGRIRRVLLVADIVADARIMHAADLGVARIFEDLAGEAELGVGQRVHVAGLEDRGRIIGRLEAVGIDALQVGDGRAWRGRDCLPFSTQSGA